MNSQSSQILDIRDKLSEALWCKPKLDDHNIGLPLHESLVISLREVFEIILSLEIELKRGLSK